jgi:hypothetical protein
VDALIVDQGGPGAIQDTAYVSTNGLCSGHSPCSSNVHTAVTSASHPSVINITQENYTENIALAFDQAITLAGGWNANFTSDSGFTTIQGSLTITHGIMILENIILK